MKFGFRKPSLKKSLKARTTGRIKRSIKRSINPLYGKKGAGYIKNPKKALYNKVYNKTTVGISDFKKSQQAKSSHQPKKQRIKYVEYTKDYFQQIIKEPNSKKQFQINSMEYEFLNALFNKFDEENMNHLYLNRMSDGTLNVQYYTMQIGRIKLYGRKSKMQVLRLTNPTTLDIDVLWFECLPLEEYINKINDWILYAKTY